MEATFDPSGLKYDKYDILFVYKIRRFFTRAIAYHKDHATGFFPRARWVFLESGDSGYGYFMAIQELWDTMQHKIDNEIIVKSFRATLHDSADRGDRYASWIVCRGEPKTASLW